MKRICIFTLYGDKGASSQFRTYIFREALEKDFSIKFFYFWNNEYVTKYMVNKKKYALRILLQYIVACLKRIFQLLIIAPKYDVVYIQKACFPKSKLLLLKHLKGKTKIVFDIDDAVYLSKGDNSDRIATIADAVICGNENLKKHYSTKNNYCTVIPTIENTHKYTRYWGDTYEDKIIGWIGSKATLDNLDLIVNPVNAFISTHPEVKFHIISNDAGNYAKLIKNAIFIPWSKEKYIEEIGKFTIGIMPLKDTQYNRGKCGFKLIQYLNMKKPVIGSPVGINSDIILGNGISADNEVQWEKAFEQLLYDRSIYNKCVEHIEHCFFKQYHFDSAYQKMKGVLEN